MGEAIGNPRDLEDSRGILRDPHGQSEFRILRGLGESIGMLVDMLGNPTHYYDDDYYYYYYDYYYEYYY
eukprot:6859634-Pyramimonas_sp.AAC.1